MGIDPFVDFPGEWALLALGYMQPLQYFTSHLIIWALNQEEWQRPQAGQNANFLKQPNNV